MSNISFTHHTVIPFVAGETKPLSGQRLAKVGYKKTKDQPNPPASIAVSLPQFSDQELIENASKLVAILRAGVEDAQDKIVRALYESRNYNLDRVADDEIGIAAVVGYISSEQSGGRLTKEYLESWFDTNLRDNLTVVIADKLGFEELSEAQLETVNKHLAGYRGVISSLAGGKTMLSVAQINGVKRALEVSSVDDEVTAKLHARLSAMEDAHNNMLLAL